MISLSVVLVVAVVCISIEAFFSGSEIAMVSASRPRLRSQVKDGNRGAMLAEKYLDRPQTLLATTLLGTNLATVTFSVTVTVFLAQGGYGNGELLAVLMVTPFTLMLGEVIPKTIFQQRADELVTRLIFPLHAASLVLRPFILLVGGFANVTSKVFGAEGQRSLVTREELSLLLDAAESSNSPADADITESEREMITNLLEMSGATVSTVMLPLSEITAIPQETTVTEAVREVADKQHSRMPVYEGRVDNIVGVLHVFDLLQVGAHEVRTEIRNLARPAHYVPESVLAVDLLGELQGSGKTMAIVVDEYGGAVGVVTIEDLLEEIVGEIEDEHDDAGSLIVADQPGVWTVEAKVSVERVNDELGLGLPTDDSFESIAGLILHKLRRLPNEGDTVLVGDVTLRITKATNRAVTQVQLLRRRKREADLRPRDGARTCCGSVYKPPVGESDTKQLVTLLGRVQSGELSVEDAVQALSGAAPGRVGDIARLDHLREQRTGAPEIVYGEGKTAEQIATLMKQLAASGKGALATRVSQEKAEVVRRLLKDTVVHHEVARSLEISPNEQRSAGRGIVGVVCAGTSDIPAAEEAAVCMRFLGHGVLEIRDIGVAGLHRLLGALPELQKCSVLIIAAGMEGALPTVVAGLLPTPIVALPTSVGYGVSAGGYAALAGMLSSCAPGLCVVNIDNGVGAALAAARINRADV